jgi:hypothetical protein
MDEARIHRQEATAMPEAIVVPVVLFAAVLGLFAWRVRLDRRQARALALRAEIQSAVDRALEGESFLSVRVTPASGRHAGRVELVTPSGYEWLLDDVWHPVLRTLPRDYELVVRPAA